jgi:hypothetical protein
MNLRNQLAFTLSHVLALCIVALAACTTLLVSPEDYLRSAQAEVGAVYQTIGDLKAQAQITQAQAKSAIAKTEKIELDLEAADVLMRGGDLSTAQNKAKLALAALLLIKSELKPKPKS